MPAVLPSIIGKKRLIDRQSRKGHLAGIKRGETRSNSYLLVRTQALEMIKLGVTQKPSSFKIMDIK